MCQTGKRIAILVNLVEDVVPEELKHVSVSCL
jgi:hypothetical protein